MKIITNLTIFLLLVCPASALASDERLHARALRYFEPLPESMPGSENDTAELIRLGKTLFFDKRLSINDTQACVSCHKLGDGFAGVDNLPVAIGARGEVGTRNSPTVLNAGWQEDQFWDGRAEGLVEQAKGPILNPIEMGMPDEQAVVNKLSGIDEYVKLFARAFSEQEPAISYQNIAVAIAAFERTLISRSRFDRFLQGDFSALNQTEKQGLEVFMDLDCQSCHYGVMIGGEAYEVLGVEHEYENQSDTGVHMISKDENDRMVFKVAPLRNVALTAPYFHDGRINKLDEAIRLMAKLQLDVVMTDQQVSDIEAFLITLTGVELEK